MNIPFNDIYDYLDCLVDEDAIIYRFFPPGSKKLVDLRELRFYSDKWEQIPLQFKIIMHDQEPLYFELYNEWYVEQNIDEYKQCWQSDVIGWNHPIELRKKIINSNLSSIYLGHTIWDRNIIVHSETNSTHVEKYKAIGLEPVYYWSHALIARDWYRYAEHDPRLQNLPDQFDKDFCIYNRAWSGTREYRLKVADLIIEKGLTNQTNLRFNAWDNGLHYRDHVYKNTLFQPQRNLEQLPLNTSEAASSASYSATDYQRCWWDVVLETLYDDSRNHLTEKSLRPIACGKPFLMFGTPGSLDYLRSYGFQTFQDCIDESYDQELDPVKRMHQIITVMQQLSEMSTREKLSINKHIKIITKHNKSLFFSRQFVEKIINEFQTNYRAARQTCELERNGRNWRDFRRVLCQDPDMKNYLLNSGHFGTRKQILKLMQEVTNHRMSRTPSQSAGSSDTM